MKLNISLIIGLLLLLVPSCKDKSKTQKNSEVSFTKEGVLNIFKAETDSIIKTIDIEIADNDYEVQTGLMYRNGMKNHQGMLFVFPEAQPRFFYMKNTRFSLDIIFLDSDKKIVSFQKNTKPFDESSLPSNVPAQYVLELNAGLIEQWNLQIGDYIRY
jgi:uncharacterized protein